MRYGVDINEMIDRQNLQDEKDMRRYGIRVSGTSSRYGDNEFDDDIVIAEQEEKQWQ